jgi:hypothetical protein
MRFLLHNKRLLFLADIDGDYFVGLSGKELVSYINYKRIEGRTYEKLSSSIEVVSLRFLFALRTSIEPELQPTTN